MVATLLSSKDAPSPVQAADYVSVGNLEILLAKQVVKVDGRHVSLSPKEYKSLAHLLTHLGLVISSSEVQRSSNAMSSASARRQIKRIRGKLHNAGWRGDIETVFGYRINSGPEGGQ